MKNLKARFFKSVNRTKYILQGYLELGKKIAKEGTKAIETEELGKHQMDNGDIVFLMLCPFLDIYQNLPQALVTKVKIPFEEQAAYIILVGRGWKNLSQQGRHWVVAHELGHIHHKHLDNFKEALISNIKRAYLPWTDDNVLKKELEADAYANKYVGTKGGLEFFNRLIRTPFWDEETQKRSRATELAAQEETRKQVWEEIIEGLSPNVRRFLPEEKSLESHIRETFEC